jgi:hypothetical protein
MSTEPKPRRNRPVTPPIDPEAFSHNFGESLIHLLDSRTWERGRDLDAEYCRIEEEVAHAVAHATEFQAHIRARVHPLLSDVENAPPGAGIHAVSADDIAAVQRGLLFNGATPSLRITAIATPGVTNSSAATSTGTAAITAPR